MAQAVIIIAYMLTKFDPAFFLALAASSVVMLVAAYWFNFSCELSNVIILGIKVRWLWIGSLIGVFTGLGTIAIHLAPPKLVTTVLSAISVSYRVALVSTLALYLLVCRAIAMRINRPFLTKGFTAILWMLGLGLGFLWFQRDFPSLERALLPHKRLSAFGQIGYWTLGTVLLTIKGLHLSTAVRQLEANVDPTHGSLDSSASADPTKWCKKCGSSLDGLRENRCPECGTSFDPSRPRTLRLNPPLSRMHKTIRVMTVAFLALLLHVLVVYWAPLIEWPARVKVERRPNLILFREPWTPTSYHALYAEWAEIHGLPVPARTERIKGMLPTDADLIAIKTLRYVTDLDLAQTRITDEGLGHIKDLKNLTHLDLRRTRITDHGLAQISGLKNLQFLSLGQTSVTDEGLARVKKLTNLRQLKVDQTDITDDGLTHIGGLGNLRYLNLKNTRITDDGLAQIKLLKNLEGLYLGQTCITDNGLAHIMEMKNLKWLDVSQTEISVDGLAYIKALPALHSLDLSQTSITDEGLVYIRRMKNLRWLYVHQTGISGDGIQSIMWKKNLYVFHPLADRVLDHARLITADAIQTGH
jgi:hypothetical protein